MDSNRNMDDNGKSLDKLKARAYDLIAMIEAHNNEIQRLKQELLKINQQISNEAKHIQESKVSPKNRASKPNEHK